MRRHHLVEGHEGAGDPQQPPRGGHELHGAVPGRAALGRDRRAGQPGFDLAGLSRLPCWRPRARRLLPWPWPRLLSVARHPRWSAIPSEPLASPVLLTAASASKGSTAPRPNRADQTRSSAVREATVLVLFFLLLIVAAALHARSAGARRRRVGLHQTDSCPPGFCRPDGGHSAGWLLAPH